MDFHVSKIFNTIFRQKLLKQTILFKSCFLASLLFATIINFRIRNKLFDNYRNFLVFSSIFIFGLFFELLRKKNRHDIEFDDRIEGISNLGMALS